MSNLPKTPPHDLVAQEAILSHCLGQPDAIDDVRELLPPEVWYGESHKLTWESMLAMHDAEQTIDVVSLARHLRDRDRLEQVGGSAFMAQLCDAAPIVNPIEHARAIADKAKLRKLIVLGRQIAAEAMVYAGDVGEFVSRCEQAFFELGSAAADDDVVQLPELVSERLDVFKKRSEGGDAVDCIRTGITELDNKIGGWTRKFQHLIAARPSMGKTAFILQILRAACQLDRNGQQKYLNVFFSLEQPREQCAERMLCQASGVANTDLRFGRIGSADWQQIAGAAQVVGGLPLVIIDKSSLTVSALRSHLRRELRKAQKRFGPQLQLGVVAIDYIQLMRGEGRYGNREAEVSDVSRGLLATGKDFNVAFLTASQLNRTNVKEKRAPTMADLRESGQIEQDAQLIMFLHDSEGRDHPCPDQILIRKQREGAVGGNVDVVFDGPTLTFNSPVSQADAEYGLPFDEMDDRYR